MGAHYGIIWLEAETLAGRMSGSPPVEMMLSLEKGICLMKPIQKDYLVFLILTPSGNLGQAKRWIKWASDEILREM
jgi:predicted regulator of Ras-like GTPase activity (Roadblock/LC7/MglB family)